MLYSHTPLGEQAEVSDLVRRFHFVKPYEYGTYRTASSSCI
jgi:hypothetical protein